MGVFLDVWLWRPAFAAVLDALPEMRNGLSIAVWRRGVRVTVPDKSDAALVREALSETLDGRKWHLALEALNRLAAAAERADEAEEVSQQDWEAFKTVRDELKQAEATVARLRDALRHYGDKGNWDEVTPGPQINMAGYVAFEYAGGYELPWDIARRGLAQDAETETAK